MKRKVLLAIPSMGSGGAQRFLLELVKHLPKDRFFITVLVLGGRENSFFEKELIKQQAEVLFLSKHHGPSMTAVCKIIKILHERKPDVVHTNLHALYYLLPAVWIMRTPVRLHTVHSIAPMEAAGFARILSRFAFRHGGFLPVSVGKGVQKSVMQIYKLTKSDAPCIVNGVSLQKKEHPVNKDTDRIHVISVGALWPPKNQKLLIDAMERACKKDRRLTLTIFGEGVLREDLEDRIRRYHLTDRIFLPGNTEEIEKELILADIFALSSDYEGLPFCILEAMACGLPIVATDICGVSELVKDKENGFLCPAKDRDALAKAILTLAENRKLRERMGKASCRIVKQYDIKDMAKKYMALYEGSAKDIRLTDKGGTL